MKNYYYILGIDPHASDEAVRAAYKKLSMKFHPDKNDGDTFFEQHFKEIQEAYAVLSNSTKRQQYDQQFNPPRKRNQPIDTSRPIIQVFDASKTNVREGEPMTLTWAVVHADVVEINVLGKVANRGTKTLRISEIKGNSTFTLKIKAQNTNIQQKSEKHLLIRNKSHTQQPVGHPNTSVTTFLDDDDDAINVAQHTTTSINFASSMVEPKANPVLTTTNQPILKFADDDELPIPLRNEALTYVIVTGLMLIISLLSYLVYYFSKQGF